MGELNPTSYAFLGLTVIVAMAGLLGSNLDSWIVRPK